MSQAARDHRNAAPGVLVLHPVDNLPAPRVKPQAEIDLLDIGRVPHIALHAFCRSRQLRSAVEGAAADWRMARAVCEVREGTIRSAIQGYASAPTPDLLILEAGDGAEDALVSELTSLAEVCDATTKVVVVGQSNDILLYRRLLDLGIAEYLLAPLEPTEVIALASRLFRRDGAAKLGRSCAFIGATGGAGSSTLAQNVAWTMAAQSSTDIMLADFDLPFGTTDLGFNLEAGGGAVEAVRGADRLDEMLLERMLVKRGEHLRLLPAGGQLRDVADLPEESFEKLLDVAQGSFPWVIVDLPHGWSTAVRETLLAADDIVIVAQPDLPGLRNARGMVDFLRQARPNDPAPKLVLNQVRMARRTEIRPKDFVEAAGLEATAIIRSDPATFSAAATRGQMIGEHARRAPACKGFREIVDALTGRRSGRRGLFGLGRRQS